MEACSGHRPLVTRLGHPGYEHGRSGLVPTVPLPQPLHFSRQALNLPPHVAICVLLSDLLSCSRILYLFRIFFSCSATFEVFSLNEPIMSPYPAQLWWFFPALIAFCSPLDIQVRLHLWLFKASLPLVHRFRPIPSFRHVSWKRNEFCNNRCHYDPIVSTPGSMPPG